MKNIIDAINGHKTYIISGATIVYVALGIILHFITIPAGLTIIGGLGSIAALRLGVAKVQGILEIVLELLQVIGTLNPAVPSTTTTVSQTTVVPEVTSQSATVTETPVVPMEPVKPTVQ